VEIIASKLPIFAEQAVNVEVVHVAISEFGLAKMAFFLEAKALGYSGTSDVFRRASDLDAVHVEFIKCVVDQQFGRTRDYSFSLFVL
jgi:hypothetical protein